jgi:ribonuclease PH
LKKLAKEFPSLNRALKTAVAAVSVGMVSGEAVLDLNYVEDKDAGVDMNIVMTSANQFIEVQGTAEAVPFNREQMNALLDVATVGLTQLFEIQKQTLAI